MIATVLLIIVIHTVAETIITIGTTATHAIDMAIDQTADATMIGIPEIVETTETITIIATAAGTTDPIDMIVATIAGIRIDVMTIAIAGMMIAIATIGALFPTCSMAVIGIETTIETGTIMTGIGTIIGII